MNENIDLTKILKDCPKGTKLYSIIYGEVEFNRIKEECTFSIIFATKDGYESTVTSDGMHYKCYDGDCTLFPSKDQRDWSKFKPKKPKFDPKTLKPFDKILVKQCDIWHPDFYSCYIEDDDSHACSGLKDCYFCIPYNDDTKHLAGTKDEAPEYYRYWED